MQGVRRLRSAQIVCKGCKWCSVVRRTLQVENQDSSAKDWGAEPSCNTKGFWQRAAQWAPEGHTCHRRRVRSDNRNTSSSHREQHPPVVQTPKRFKLI